MKKILIIMLSITILLTLTSCGKKKEVLKDNNTYKMKMAK